MKRLVCTYHHGFAGGSKNTSRLLHYVSKFKKIDVQGYFFQNPQYFDYTDSRINKNLFDLSSIESEVIDKNYLTLYKASDQIISDISRIDLECILLGTNLFPYCDIMHNVKAQIISENKTIPKLIMHPVGSDIWQIGPQVKSRVKWLIDSPLVSQIFTYSQSFIDEIQEYYNINRKISIIPPILEIEKFKVLDEHSIIERRNYLGFSSDDFIMHHHSSMRTVKCPEIVLQIAIKSSQSTMRNSKLIMVGPIPFDMIRALNLPFEKIDNGTSFLYVSKLKTIAIYWTGVVERVEYLLQIADVEINASLHDSFNVSLMEAMGCGIPVISSNIVGIRRHIELAKSGNCFATIKLGFDELNGYFHSGRNKDSLFNLNDAISMVCSIEADVANAKKMGVAGADYVFKEFHPVKISNQFFEYIYDRYAGF